MVNSKLQRILLITVLLASLFLLAACSDAEQTGRDVGKALHDFWQGFVQGCSGNALLPMMAGVIGWFCISRAKKE